MPFTYIVECADTTYYVGSTWDLERRIGEHNEGLGAEYTRRRRPVRLVWSVQLNRIDEAYRVEKQTQGWGRAKRLALIEGRYDDLPGLARTARPRDEDSEVAPTSTDELTDHHTPVSTSSTDEATDHHAVVSTSSTDEPTDHHTAVSTSSTDEPTDGVRRSRGR